jgi:hypothetical protein
MQPTIKEILLSEFYTRAEVRLKGYHEISTEQMELLAGRIEAAVKREIMIAFSNGVFSRLNSHDSVRDGLDYYNKTFKQPTNA